MLAQFSAPPTGVLAIGSERGNFIWPPSNRSWKRGPVEEMDVRLRFTPDARLEFVVPPVKAASVKEAIRQWASPMKIEKLRLQSTNVTFGAFPTQRGSDGTIFSPTEEPVALRGNVTDLSKAVVHLFNFPEFHASSGAP